MRASLILLVLILYTSLVSSVPVYVMLSLTTISNEGTLNNAAHLSQQLSQLKDGGVTGVMTDVWWGIVEQSPRNYNWKGYLDLMKMCSDIGLKVQAVMSFHRCGGNVGDDCNIPLPSWVRNYGNSDPEIWYTDVRGHRDTEYISLGSDNEVIEGRQVLQIYRDFMQSFANNFAVYLKNGVIDQIQVGTGPCGELRYPSYQTDVWSFPGVGAFQCFDKRMMASWRSYASSHGHPEWDSPPTDAGYYNSRPSETSFFSNGYTSTYGQSFLNWYSSILINHGEDILKISKAVFNNGTAGFQSSVSTKISGIHWWYNSDSHAAELTAGYYNTRSHEGYGPIMEMMKRNGVYVDFTCFEMLDSEQHDCDCSPEGLVHQTLIDAKNMQMHYAGENALSVYDPYHYNNIVNHAKSVLKLDSFTYLRLSDDLLNGGNWNNFCSFVNSMRSLGKK